MEWSLDFRQFVALEERMGVEGHSSSSSSLLTLMMIEVEGGELSKMMTVHTSMKTLMECLLYH